MRDLTTLDAYRIAGDKLPRSFGGWAGDGTCGAFTIPIDGVDLLVIAATGAGWDHVSVSLMNRTPRWREMDAVKRRFFKPDELAIQIHPPEVEHINIHPYCLHLWRPHHFEIPLPPRGFV